MCLKLYVKNLSQLTPNNIKEESLALRKIGLNSLEVALSSVEPKKLLQNTIKVVKNNLIISNDVYDLSVYREILIIGGGKASAQMALAIEEILEKYNKISYKGIINVPDNLDLKDSFTSSKIRVNLASHPIPNESGLNGTKFMFSHIENTTKDDLIIFLLSGGGSALLPMPKDTISLVDLQVTNSLLLMSGASIREVNTVRKHLSAFKGGNLAKKIYESSKATVISLIISDVVGNNLESIASGPTVPDLTTFKDAFNVLNSFELINKVPPSVKQLIERGMNDSNLNKPSTITCAELSVSVTIWPVNLGNVQNFILEAISLTSTVGTH